MQLREAHAMSWIPIKQTNTHNHQIREGFELNCGWVGVKSLKILVRIQCHVYMAYLTILSILFVHVSDQFPEICGRFRTFWKVVGVGGWGDNLHTSEHTLDVLLFFSNLSSLILFFRQQTNMETEKPLSSCGWGGYKKRSRIGCADFLEPISSQRITGSRENSRVSLNSHKFAWIFLSLTWNFQWKGGNCTNFR